MLNLNVKLPLYAVMFVDLNRLTLHAGVGEQLVARISLTALSEFFHMTVAFLLREMTPGLGLNACSLPRDAPSTMYIVA